MAKFKLRISDEKFYEQIYQDYGKTKKDMDEYVDLLMEWAKTQKHFPEMPSYNGVRFCVAACKFSMERAKEKIDMYYTIRRLMPEVFNTHPLSPQMMRQGQAARTVDPGPGACLCSCHFVDGKKENGPTIFQHLVTKELKFRTPEKRKRTKKSTTATITSDNESTKICVLLPKVTEKNERIVYAQMNPDFSPEDFKHDLFLVQITHLIEICLQEDNCYNFVTIIDCLGIKLGHVSKFNPMAIKKMAVVLEKVYANRVSSIYMVNFHPFLENVLNTMFRPLLPAKIRDRLKAYDGTEVLFRNFDKSILPSDIGGDEKSLAELREMMIEKFQEWKPRFDSIQYMTVDESQRPSKLKNDDILGYYGSFKQISVD